MSGNHHHHHRHSRRRDEREHTSNDRSLHRRDDYRERDKKQFSLTELNLLTSKLLKAKSSNSSEVEALQAQLDAMKEKNQADDEQRKKSQARSDAAYLKHSYAEEINPEEMTIEDMVREEKTTDGVVKSSIQAILKDGKYSNDLDYQENNASSLSRHLSKGTIDLKTMQASQINKVTRILDACQLCIENDNACDILSMGDKVYLTLPPDPWLVKYSTMIVPINHVKNTLHCDTDEWEEIRNYMISLSKFYYTELNKAVIFYESSTYKYNHAAILAIPIPLSLVSSIKGYFKQAFTEENEDFNQQHKAIIDTSNGGRDGFRHSIAKEAPYFHVWFNLNGGMAHIVEDVTSWPKGDLFARRLLGAVLKIDPQIINRQGKWSKNDYRVQEMSKIWRKYDWTENLS